jgi:ABC-type Fe3+ transport system permease subunit
MLLADIDFADVIWSMIMFFFFVIFLWMIFGIIGDIFRSDDLGGGSKALWCIFIVFLPFLAIFIYLIVRGHGMAERAMKSNAQAQAQFESYVRETAGSSGAAGEITSAKALLDSGAISQEEFERIKASAMAKT